MYEYLVHEISSQYLVMRFYKHRSCVPLSSCSSTVTESPEKERRWLDGHGRHPPLMSTIPGVQGLNAGMLGQTW